MKCRKLVRSYLINRDMMAGSDIAIGDPDYGAKNTKKNKANSLWEQWKMERLQMFRAKEIQRRQRGHIHDHIYAQTIIRILK